MLDPRIEDNAEEIKALKFKLKTLENFVFKHRHDTFDYETRKLESSHPFVWVNTPSGYEKEPKEKVSEK